MVTLFPPSRNRSITLALKSGRAYVTMAMVMAALGTHVVSGTVATNLDESVKGKSKSPHTSPITPSSPPSYLLPLPSLTPYPPPPP